MYDEAPSTWAGAKRVVVLGHSGFLGRHLVGRLRRLGVDVVGHSSETLDLRQLEAFRILDCEWQEDTALVIAAALTPDRGRSLDQLQDNLIMSLNIARFVQTHPARLVTYVSSDAVYPFGNSHVTEESVPNPTGGYAFAKFAGERIIGESASGAGCPFLLLRPTAVYGAGDTHDAYGPNRFIRSIVRAGVVHLFGGGEETRDHLYIDDATELTTRLIRADATGTFNLATGISQSFAQVAEALRPIAPEPFRVVHLPRRTPITHRTFDISRLRNAIGAYTFVPFSRGLRATYEATIAQVRTAGSA